MGMCAKAAGFEKDEPGYVKDGGKVDMLRSTGAHALFLIVNETVSS